MKIKYMANVWLQASVSAKKAALMAAGIDP